MSGEGGSLRAAARACFDAAVAGVAPRPLVAAALRRDGDELTLAVPAATARHRGPVVVVGAGKAAAGMVAGVPGPAGLQGLIVVPHGTTVSGPPGIELARGAHPVPDAAGEVATARLLACAGGAGADTLVLVLLSGGASSLLVAPAPGLTLEDKQRVTAALLASGADIAAINTVRKHCSQVKGGGLVRAAARAAALWTLIVSDVIGDDCSTIASGPTVADPTTFGDALAALDRWLAPAAVPAALRAHLEAGRRGEVPETLKPGDPGLARAVAVVLAGNGAAVAAAAAAARGRGFEPHVVATPFAGDAAAVGRQLVARLADLPRDRPVALVAGGETTVRVVAGGRGGRSQHLALAAAMALAGRPGVLLAAGTDGIDGPTDVAGACVDGGTLARARARGFDAAAALAATDSLPVLEAAGDLFRTGPTGTNVADLVVALRGAC